MFAAVGRVRYKSQVPGSEKCKTCMEAKLECTYFTTPVKRRTKSHVEVLESRLKESEAQVIELRAELTRAYMHTTPTTTSSGNSDKSTNGQPLNGLTAWLHVMRNTMASLYGPPAPPDADDLLHLEFNKLSLEIKKVKEREHVFIGKSAGVALIKATADIKSMVHTRTGSKMPRPSPRTHICGWRPETRKNITRRTSELSFPTEPLLSELIGLYFTHQNIYLPLLHRPTFERLVAEGLHLRDGGFAATVLLVCAIASRWSMEPSAVDAGAACGREWFDQVPIVEDRFFERPTLYDLQYYCLAVIFLDGSAASQACWTLVGIGLRLAEDIGLHIRKSPVPSVEDELYKRAFWVLLYLDRVISAEMGRTCAMQYDDFDIYPLREVDDEHWEHPTHPFQQPRGVPSRVAFFNALMRLNHILGFCLISLYRSDRLLALFSIHGPWKESAVPELDSVLNTWHAHIPAHLRWDPTRKDQVFFDQSVALHCGFYHLQILIHRALLRNFAATSALSSLTICTTAAQACANMVDIQRRRNGTAPAVINLQAVFSSALILMLQVWTKRRTASALVPDQNREMVQNCMDVMLLYDSRWQNAGILWNILANLACVGRLLPDASDAPHSTSAHNQSNIEIEPVPPHVETHFLLDDMYPDPTQASRELEEMMKQLDDTTMAMWVNAPMGLEADIWATYLDNLGDITRGFDMAEEDTGTNGH
ncbi:fungal-specific transcription factor domain-containing protein [Mycena olivaceomarginata]|nr:fungal-specific transcription factor domain-containing protein [Mycena olivaceomarginata]